MPCLEKGALGLLERVSSIQVAPEGWPRKGKGEEEDGEKGEGKESWVSHWLEAGETQKELTVKQEESS